MNQTNDKLVDLPKALDLINFWRTEDQEIIFTNGCFDILHPGHIDLLEQAKELGQKLIVGLNSDRSIQKLKGANRPINNQWDRSRVLSGLACIDLIIVFEEETPQALIEAIKPNVLVKGSDYKIENIVGANLVIANGGTVKTLSLVKGYSTITIINRILNHN